MASEPCSSIVLPDDDHARRPIAAGLAGALTGRVDPAGAAAAEAVSRRPRDAGTADGRTAALAPIAVSARAGHGDGGNGLCCSLAGAAVDLEIAGAPVPPAEPGIACAGASATAIPRVAALR